MLGKLRGIDKYIHGALIMLSVFGIIMIGSASTGSAAYLGTAYALMNMIKQFVFVIIGYLILRFLIRYFNTKYINDKTLLVLYIMTLLALLACMFFPEVNGAKRWIRIGSFLTIQPSEFSKIVIILLLSYFFTEVPKALSTIIRFRNLDEKKKFEKRKMWECFFKPMLYSLIIVHIALVNQGDTGTAAIMLFIIGVCFLSTNSPYYKKMHFYFFITVFFILIIGLLVIILVPELLQNALKAYQGARIASWLDPFSSIQNSSYQIVNGLLSFVKGGFGGVGFANSTLKYGYIPEAHNDYITAIISEELGLIGLLLIIIPYCIIIFKLINHAFEIGNSKDKIILMGIASYFFIHLFLNLGGVSGLIPMTGVPLLCVSSGGSGVLSAYISIGIAQSIIRKNNLNATIK